MECSVMRTCSAEEFFNTFARAIKHAEKHYAGWPAFLRKLIETEHVTAVTDGVDGLVLELRAALPSETDAELFVWFGVTNKHDGKFIHRVDPYLAQVARDTGACKVKMQTSRTQPYMRRAKAFIDSGLWKESHVC